MTPSTKLEIRSQIATQLFETTAGHHTPRAQNLFAKLLFWNHFDIGIAPVVVGLFFFGSVQLVALGVIGEYIGSIHTMVQNRPLVIEKERINFEETLQR